MPKDNCDNLRLYWSFIKRNSSSFQCPLCNVSLVSIQFEKHCSALHNLNPRLCCVWCLGKTSWSSKQKLEHVDHLLHCWRKFLKQNTLPPPENSTFAAKPEPVAFDSMPMAQAKCLFDHAFDPPPPPRALDLVWPMPLDPNPLTFEDESLDRAVSSVRKYLELGDRAEWFHVMVRIPAFQGFLEAMDGDEGRTRTLTFSCWCDGGEPREARFRQHRHMIVVSSPPGHFLRDVWAKIEVGEQRPRRNFRCLFCKRIDSPMQLVHTIGYLSKCESRCNFSSKYKDNSPEKQNHFYCFESLPKDYRLPLVLQWEGGLMSLLNLIFKDLKRDNMVRADMDFFESKWRFKIKNIPGITLGTVLPVAKEFQPCRGPTDYFIHLTKDRKLFFERNPILNNLTRGAWLERQAQMGNLFYFVVGEDHWTPRPYLQSLINEFKPIVDRNRELESENARLKEENETLKREVEELKQELDSAKRSRI